MSQFAWVEMYEEIAAKLLDYENRQGELISLIQDMLSQGLKPISPNDRDKDGNQVLLQEIDPFTFFASFNRDITPKNRSEILAYLKQTWDLKAEVPTAFEGIPTTNNQSSWFFPYVASRKQEDIPNLWKLAWEAVTGEPEQLDQKLFDTCLQIKEIGIKKLTMGLFWLCPDKFIPVDKNNQAFFKAKGIELTGKDAAGYFAYLKQISSSLGRDYPEFSQLAIVERAGESIDPAENPTPKQRSWVFSPGEKAKYWPDFLKDGFISIDYEVTQNLLDFKSMDEITEVLERKNTSGKRPSNNSLACWEFARELKPGDVVFVKEGRTGLLGCGQVTSEYQFWPDATYRHVRKMEWLASGKWSLQDNLLPMKTLTEITKNPDLIETLSNLCQVNFQPNTGTIPDFQTLMLPLLELLANKQEWSTQDLKQKLAERFHLSEEAKLAKLKSGEPVWGNRVRWAIQYLKQAQVLESTRRGFYQITERGQEILRTKAEKIDVKLLEQFPEFRRFKNRNLDEENTEFQPDALIPIYTITEAKTEIFLTEAELNDIVSHLDTKKNIILQGPPGVGKTFVAKRLAYLKMKEKDDSRVEMVQFHQSYSYEDFIQGFRLNGSGGFTRKDGIFHRFCHKARQDAGRDYFFIIDEINRGNLSRIFGELMMLIEHDKRGQQFALPLTYHEETDERFFIPENLHLIGTMNTADRSLALVDYALRRRFAFVDIKPKIGSLEFESHLAKEGVSPEVITWIRERVSNLNGEIAKDTRSLGEGFQIGHSYFCHYSKAKETHQPEAWFKQVIEGEILPLLKEYWMDQPKEITKWGTWLLEGK